MEWNMCESQNSPKTKFNKPIYLLLISDLSTLYDWTDLNMIGNPFDGNRGEFTNVCVTSASCNDIENNFVKIPIWLFIKKQNFFFFVTIKPNYLQMQRLSEYCCRIIRLVASKWTDANDSCVPIVWYMYHWIVLCSHHADTVFVHTNAPKTKFENPILWPVPI